MDRDLGALDAPTLHLGAEFPAHLVGRSPMIFRHTLAEDPALSLESVALLAESLDDGSVTCEAAIKPLVVPEDAPAATSSAHAGELIRHLDEDESWLTLLNIEQSAPYRALIDQYIDAMARRCGLQPAMLRRRMGFVFASSPQSVTPAHFDIEHSLLIQLRGSRTLSFGTFADSASRAHEVHRYWTGSFGRLQSLPKSLTDFHLGPGDGAYIPPYYPHWLQNEDASSLSITGSSSPARTKTRRSSRCSTSAFAGWAATRVPRAHLGSVTRRRRRLCAAPCWCVVCGVQNALPRGDRLRRFDAG